MADAAFDDRDGQIWLDGKLIPWRDAKLHVLTHGLHYASAVFEGVRVYNGKIFKNAEHNQRLIKSAELLGFKIPYSLEQLNKACEEVVKSLTDAGIKPIRGTWTTLDPVTIGKWRKKIHERPQENAEAADIYWKTRRMLPGPVPLAHKN